MNRVFVYGTLKRNQPNHHWLSDPKNGEAKFVGVGETTVKYPLIIGTKYNIPFLLDVPGTGHFIKGEIYDVNQEMLKNLDYLEDHPIFYERSINPVKMDNETVECWIYLLKKYKPDLLNLTMYDDYSNEGPHGLKYCESNNESSLEDL